MLEAIEASYFGKMLVTFVVSMAPVVELRGGIPFGAALGLDPLSAAAAAVLGNLVPVPFIILFVRYVFAWLKRFPRLGSLVERMEKKAHLKSRTVMKYQKVGLCILVAIPLPGTGAWTGALVAAIMDMRLKRAVPPIVAGVLIAAGIVSCITYGLIAALF
ncbi:MAG: COG2426 family protein [Anaerovoracaceae bacterium]